MSNDECRMTNSLFCHSERRRRIHFIFIILTFYLSVFLLFSCGHQAEYTKDGRRIVTYWEKWTGFEGQAMQAVVDSFNAGQDSIFVQLMTVSRIDQKVLIATAGGDPPDVAGLFSVNLAAYADNYALLPLDDYFARAGMSRDDYIPIYINMCDYHGHLWALPSTPASVALHWNKALFREAGLDPERPPRTLAELDQFAEKLTKYDKDGHLVQLGFLPAEPGWWPWAWGYWFGGKLMEGDSVFTINSPQNLAAFKWVASYSKKYGSEELKRFSSGFGNFSSPQNAFLSGLVAMEMQGVWMHNFIEKYAPGMEWGVAPFPTAIPGLDSVSAADADILVIPRGARSPDQAFAFIKYVNSPKGMELLCMGQRKNSPLIKTSDWFRKNHPHPYIDIFTGLSKSPHVFTTPQTGVNAEFSREIRVAVDRIRFLEISPVEALNQLQERMQNSLDRHRKQIKIRNK
jgi:multiple sugar transport system substrate-binding protein